MAPGFFCCRRLVLNFTAPRMTEDNQPLTHDTAAQPLAEALPSARAGAWREIGPMLLTLAVVGGAVWSIYGRALNTPFIYDDNMSVVSNPSLVRLWPLVSDEYGF